MLWSKDQWNMRCLGRATMVALAAIGATWLSMAAPEAFAQQPGTSAGGPTANGGIPEAAWVKLCEDNAQTGNKKICLTNHERLDGNSGMVLVAAAIRSVEGQDKQTLLVRLPTAIALAIPAGVQIRVDKNKPVMLQYTLCYATSCQAETQVTPELLKEFRNGKQLVVAAVNLQRKAIGFPVPLEGFGKAYDGPPVDTAKYQEARRKLMEMIRKRQIELANKAAEAEKKKEAAAAGGDNAGKGANETASTAPAPSGPPVAQPATAVPVH